ncbi:hypothetical protein EK21DRAFT_118159 [Setomelanomma holmii]|uniref:Uncharacterized protein n=1 Tax=Setomelanomma holmii TaxID=210430 RepID=A0A9P4GYK0_9PLEO|nr:hypothetical protein EK21DRAFT_118159 [Setomelanomma holmii]
MKREVHLVRDVSEDTEEDLAQFMDEGIEIIRIPWTESIILTSSRSSLTGRRSIGDRRTLVIDLSMFSVQESSIEDGFIESSTFQMIVATEDTSRSRPIRSLYYNLVGDRSSGDNDRYHQHSQKLKERLDELTMMELMKMKSSERPWEYNRLKEGDIKANNLKLSFSTCVAWKLYDDEVIQFILQLWEHQSDPENATAPEELKAQRLEELQLGVEDQHSERSQ